MQTELSLPSTSPEVATVGIDDRRRPGRIEVAPSLVPLLRHSPDGGDFCEDMPPALNPSLGISYMDDLDEELSEPARGFLLALCIAIPLWTVIAALTYYSI